MPLHFGLSTATVKARDGRLEEAIGRDDPDRYHRVLAKPVKEQIEKEEGIGEEGRSEERSTKRRKIVETKQKGDDFVRYKLIAKCHKGCAVTCTWALIVYISQSGWDFLSQISGRLARIA